MYLNLLLLRNNHFSLKVIGPSGFALDKRVKKFKIGTIAANSFPNNLQRFKKLAEILTSESLMISPLVRQSFLLSSNTVFMFSIQTASTGPSKTYHFLSGVMLDAPPRTREDRIPSVLWKVEHTVKGAIGI